MKIYDETTGEERENPDLEGGYTYPGKRAAGTEIRLLEGTRERFPPDGLRQRVSLYEDCLFYHAYTAEEQAAGAQAAEPSQLDRVEAQVVYTAMMTDTLLEV